MLHVQGANFTIENDKGADQNARMRRLVCVFVVRINQIQVFVLRGPYKS